MPQTLASDFDDDSPTLQIAELQVSRAGGNNAALSNALPTGYCLFEYRIDRVLGHGGFGITYIATDINLESKVAIKEYFPDQLASRTEAKTVKTNLIENLEDYQHGLKRFLVEARTLAVFHHPNIVRVARFFEANNTAFIVLEYEDGKSLRSWIKATDQLNEKRLLRLVLPLIEGLGVVHKTGYLHRDIKPENIIVRNEDGSLVLLDFGSAKSITESKVDNIATPGYGPIEQYSGEAQGPYTDIYALGATLYWMITGQKPQEATERVKNDTLKSALEAGKGKFSTEFLKAIDWALKIQATERPQNINEFASALCAAQSDALGNASENGHLLLGNSGLSLVHRIYRGDTNHSRRARTVAELEQLNRHGKRIAVMVLEGSIVSGSADNLQQRIENLLADETSHIILDMRRVNYIDQAGANALIQLEKTISSSGYNLSFAHVNIHNSLWASFETHGLIKAVPKDNFYDDTDRALEFAENELLLKIMGLRGTINEVSISNFLLFETMSPKELDVLDGLLEKRSFSAGEHLFLEGSEGNELFMIASGSASVYRTLENGQDNYRVITFGENMVVGEMAFLDSQPRSATVKADTDLKCYILSRKKLAALEQKNSTVAVKILINLAGELAKRLRSANQTISSLQV